jgi:hypothetical protein
MSAAFSNIRLRMELAADTFQLLREARPSLLPWKWALGITSTNTLKDNTVFGGCGYIESNPSCMVDHGEDLLETAGKCISSSCSTYGIRNTLTAMKTSVYILIGAALLMDEIWAVVCSGDRTASSSCGNGLCMETYHMVVTTRAEQNVRAGFRRKGNSRAFCTGHSNHHDLRTCIVTAPNLMAVQDKVKCFKIFYAALGESFWKCPYHDYAKGLVGLQQSFLGSDNQVCCRRALCSNFGVIIELPPRTFSPPVSLSGRLIALSYFYAHEADRGKLIGGGGCSACCGRKREEADVSYLYCSWGG